MLDFEKFIAEIQLYGTPRQIELMIELVKAFIDKKPEISFDPLLQDLRDSLREELSMERITDTIWWYRFKLPEWKIKKEPNSERSASP